MKKLFLMGRSEAGKTSLTQVLKGEELHYHKTQYTNTGTDIIDSPGEYSETKRCGLGLACCALNPGLINRAAILYPFLSDFKLVWDLGADEIAYEGIRYYARWFDADEHQQDRWFRQLGYIDSKNFATLVQCPVLFGTGLEDVICPPQTQCAVYNNLHCKKKRYLFPGYGHEEIAEFDDMLLDFFCKEEAVL